MGFFDDAQNALGKGVSVARGAVSNVAGEQLGFVRAFGRLCSDGFAAGYHERNGGNASYRMTADDVRALRPFFYAQPSSWVDLAVACPGMAGEFLLVTGSGKYLRNVEGAPVENIGVVELNDAGSAWRLVWGLRDGGMPTSELSAHVAAFDVRKQKTDGSVRVLYHAHPASISSLTALVPADESIITRLLWKSFTETVIAIPDGIGVVPWMVPGSEELARATAQALQTHAACIWPLHGVFASGADFDEAFGIVNTVDKSAGIYLAARAAQGGKPDLPFTLSDADVRAIAQRYDLPLAEGLLNA